MVIIHKRKGYDVLIDYDIIKEVVTMEIVKGRFLEGEKVTVKIDGIEVTRKVKYNRMDGLYIIYKNRKYFEYEL